MLTKADGSQNERRHRSAWQVIGVYLAGSWVTYQLIWTLTESLGLPSWVPGACVVLFLLALPVVLAAAVMQSRMLNSAHGSAPLEWAEVDVGRGAPGTRRAEGTVANTLQRVARLRSAGILVVGGLALIAMATAVYMTSRITGVGPFATLISKGLVGERTRIIVADFDGATEDSRTAAALSEAIRIDLAQSSVAKVLGIRDLSGTLERMRATPEAQLSESVALEAAAREGIPLVLAGDITTIGSGYVITARLLHSEEETVVLRLKEEASSADHLLSATGRMVDELREEIGESPTDIRNTESLQKVTTNSLEALRLYTAAVGGADRDRNVSLLEEAVSIDSAFAMAYRKLAVSGLGRQSYSGRIDAISSAFRHSDRLPAFERLLVRALYYDYLGDPEEVIASYEAAIALQPDHTTPRNNLANFYNSLRRWDKAEETARAVLEMYPPYGAHNLSEALLGLNRVDEAEAVYDEFIPAGQVYQFGGSWAFVFPYARGDFDGAENALVHWRDSLASPTDRGQANGDLFRLYAIRGRVAEAQELISNDWWLAWLDLLYRADTLSARSRAARWERGFVMAARPPANRPYVPLAEFYARLGDTGRAADLLESYAAEVDERIRRQNEFRLYSQALVDLTAGRGEDAIAGLRRTQEESSCVACGTYALAWAFDGLGQPDSAMAAFERAVDARDVRKIRDDYGGRLPMALERLGQLHEMSGDREKAIEYYRRFVDLWAQADAEFQPKVEAARGALARLEDPHSQALAVQDPG